MSLIDQPRANFLHLIVCSPVKPIAPIQNVLARSQGKRQIHKASKKKRGK